jgi:hypothetical protein
MELRYSDVLEQIRTTGKMDAEKEERLKTALKELLGEFGITL